MDIYLERFVNDVMDRQVHRNGIFGQRMRKLTRTLLGCPALRYGGTHRISDVLDRHGHPAEGVRDDIHAAGLLLSVGVILYVTWTCSTVKFHRNGIRLMPKWGVRWLRP